jgi:type II secretion system protein H
MHATFKSGFSLIEIMVAIVLVGIMAAVIVPNLRPRKAKYEREEFIAKLNALTNLGKHNALMRNKTHRILVDLDKKYIELQAETDKKDEKGEPAFEKAKTGGYINTTFAWPKQMEVKNFYVEGFDEMEQVGGRSTKQVWFFIIPSGLAQTVTINMFDTKDKIGGGKPRPVSLVLNPFSAQFKVYDTFQK